MRLNARTGGATRPVRPGRSLTGRPGGTPNRPPQGIFWPSEYATGPEPEPGPDPGSDAPAWSDTFSASPPGDPWDFTGSHLAPGARPDPGNPDQAFFSVSRPLTDGNFRIDFTVDMPPLPLPTDGDVFIAQVGVTRTLGESDPAIASAMLVVMGGVPEGVMQMAAEYPGAGQPEDPVTAPALSGRYSLALVDGQLSLRFGDELLNEAPFPLDLEGGTIVVVVQSTTGSGAITRLDYFGLDS